MTRSDQWKLYLTIAFVLASVWTLWPTFQFYSLHPKVRQEVLQAALQRCEKVSPFSSRHDERDV